MSRFFAPGSKTRSISQLKDVLPAVGHDLDLEQRARELSLRAIWQQIVPPSFADRTCFVKLRRRDDATELLIRASDAPTAGELSFQLEHLRDALNRYAAQTGITVQRIRLTVGRVQR